MQTRRGVSEGTGKNRCELHVRPSDGPEDVAEQWQRLMAVLERPDTVLLFHLENHYCLVFAAREWRMNVGYSGKRVVRQLLVAKPGQRPGSWMDFETVRSTVLGWAGYGIIGISRREDVVLP
ncbi:hypothetical protein WJX72_009409 [[Myrmecia] bisecta]|uniref:Uncharacterized protein n=1 Tax=[Myrmecia] bisecta TaxID=41462 RepID=A0AAW1P3I7_9CHLO